MPVLRNPRWVPATLRTSISARFFYAKYINICELYNLLSNNLYKYSYCEHIVVKLFYLDIRIVFEELINEYLTSNSRPTRDAPIILLPTYTRLPLNPSPIHPAPNTPCPKYPHRYHYILSPIHPPLIHPPTSHHTNTTPRPHYTTTTHALTTPHHYYIPPPLHLHYTPPPLHPHYTRPHYTPHPLSQIFCGQNCTFAIKHDGTLYACGEGSYGRLGTGNNDNVDVLTRIEKLQGL